MGNIFISYSHKDQDFVHQLQEELLQHGFDVWMDDRIDYDAPWPKSIQDHLNNCDALILVVSVNSFESEWIQKEVARAKRIGKPVFPLLLNGNTWLSVESTLNVGGSGKELLPKKFYEQLALVTPYGAHPAGDDSIHGGPAGSPENQPPGLGAILGRWWGLISILLGVIGIAVLLWLNGTFQPPAVPLPTKPAIGASLPPTKAVKLIPLPSSSLTATPDNSGSMALVPAGNFIMGSYNGNDDEQPIHIVYLNAFYIDKYEVTNALFKRCVDANACSFPKFINSNSRVTYYGDSLYAQYPVIGVTLDMAQAYCKWRGGRLLTEAEWEKAARGPDGLAYPWGNKIDPGRANYNRGNDPNYAGDTSAVDAYPTGVSPYGLFDMAGNVWEWVSDMYAADYYASLALPVANPLGPASGMYRVTKGGSWDSTDYDLRSARRNFSDPSKANIYIGFRCARNQ